MLHVACLLGLAGCGSDPPSIGASRDGASWHRYDTSFLYFAEQPEGSTDCGAPYFHGFTSGSLGVKGASDAGGVTLHWEGMGCEIETQGLPEGPFTATAASCRFEPDAALTRFGVEDIELDEFGFDPSSGTLTAKGRMIRRKDGQQSSLCLEVPDGTLAEK